MKTILTLTLLIAGCDFRIEKGEVTLATETWFQKIQRVTLEPSCVKCHSGSNAKKGVRLNSYADLMESAVVVPGAPQTSRLIRVLRALEGAPLMPPKNPLADSEIVAIEKWVLAGAEEFLPLPGPSVEPEISGPTLPSRPEIAPTYGEPKIKFGELSEKVFAPFCISCHSGSDPDSGLDLSDYKTLIQSGAIVSGFPLESKLFKMVVENGPNRMPLDSEQLSPENIKLIHDWIQNGAENN